MTESSDEKRTPVLDYRPPAPPTDHLPVRRIMARVIGLAAIVVAVVGIMTGNPPATANCLVLAVGLGIATIFVRYGNVRL